MARMIPPSYLPDTPRGEAELFEKLRNDPGTGDWVVLHSLDLSRHRTKSSGEIDMVVLAPGLGVLCLEVKGCDVERRDGVWIYPYGTSVEGPFRQASRAMHSLRDYVNGRYQDLSRLLYWTGVVFTRIEFHEESPEWHPWQIVDYHALRRLPISRILERLLERAHQHVVKSGRSPIWYDSRLSRPTSGQVRELAALLRGNFESVVQPRSDLEQIEDSLLKLTEEQYDALDALGDNDRLLIKGLAGTGKTFLAVEAARRAARAGNRVLLLCFNRLLANWLKSVLKGFSPIGKGSVTVAHLHGRLREMAGSTISFQNSHDFWSRELPNHVLDLVLSDVVDFPAFHMLIVDEAQDIITEEYLDVLDLMLDGGLAGGRWVLFGDFDRQAIYFSEGGGTSGRMLDQIDERAPKHASFTLRTNCRNAEPIAETLTLVCNVNPGYKRLLQDMEGASVDPRFWNSKAEQADMLDGAVNELRQIFRRNEIMVLSMFSDDRSCAGTHKGHGKGRYSSLRESTGEKASNVPFSSVHAFKGLESPVVIVTDIERLNDENLAILYVAMSRARVRLILLMRENCRIQYGEMLEAGLRI